MISTELDLFIEDIVTDPELSDKEKAEFILIFAYPNLRSTNIDKKLANIKECSASERACINAVRLKFDDIFIREFYYRISSQGSGSYSRYLN